MRKPISFSQLLSLFSCFSSGAVGSAPCNGDESGPKREKTCSSGEGPGPVLHLTCSSGEGPERPRRDRHKVKDWRHCSPCGGLGGACVRPAHTCSARHRHKVKDWRHCSPCGGLVWDVPGNFPGTSQTRPPQGERLAPLLTLCRVHVDEPDRLRSCRVHVDEPDRILTLSLIHI